MKLITISDFVAHQLEQSLPGNILAVAFRTEQSTFLHLTRSGKLLTKLAIKPTTTGIKVEQAHKGATKPFRTWVMTHYSYLRQTEKLCADMVESIK